MNCVAAPPLHLYRCMQWMISLIVTFYYNLIFMQWVLHHTYTYCACTLKTFNLYILQCRSVLYISLSQNCHTPLFAMLTWWTSLVAMPTGWEQRSGLECHHSLWVISQHWTMKGRGRGRGWGRSRGCCYSISKGKSSHCHKRIATQPQPQPSAHTDICCWTCKQEGV